MEEPSKSNRVAPNNEPAQGATRMQVMLFSDIVNSMSKKEELGDQAYKILDDEHRHLMLEALASAGQGQVLELEGDSFLFVFDNPADAVGCALHAQRLHRQARADQWPDLLEFRVGIHMGTVIMEKNADGPNVFREGGEIRGFQVDTAARVMGLAKGGQILCSRGVFDDARHVMKGGARVSGIGPLEWRSHGQYWLKGREEPVEICEVGEGEFAPLRKPPRSEKAGPLELQEDLGGWRPAQEASLPGTNWVMERRLGEGGFGEVWLAQDKSVSARKTVFKFCAKKSRIKSLRRELDIFNQLFEKFGKAPPGIVQVLGAHDEEAPCYIQLEYAAGGDLSQWIKEEGRDAPLRLRLDLAVQMARALARIHEAGFVHRDIKPSNFLIEPPDDPARAPLLKLCDFGIGQEALNAALGSKDHEEQLPGGGAQLTLHTQTISEASGAYFFIAPELLLSPSPSTPPVARRAETAADLYSLGVTLYQLFAGDTETVPVAGLRNVKDPVLRQDLEACLEEKPEERPSAEELIERLEQYDERRAALEAAERERLIRQRRRARRVASSIGALLAAAILAATTALVQYRRAQQNHARSEELIQFLLYDLREKLEQTGQSPLMKTVAEKALEYYRSVPPHAQSPNSLRNRASALNDIGKVLLFDGNLEEAEKVFKEALTLAQSQTAAAPNNDKLQRDLSIVQESLGDLRQSQQEWQKALEHYRASHEIAVALSRKSQGNFSRLRDLAISHLKLGDALTQLGKTQEALAEFQKAQSIAQRSSGQEAGGDQAWKDILAASDAKIKTLERKPKIPTAPLGGKRL